MQTFFIGDNYIFFDLIHTNSLYEPSMLEPLYGPSMLGPYLLITRCVSINLISAAVNFFES
jgi:hypothetical protein